VFLVSKRYKQSNKIWSLNNITSFNFVAPRTAEDNPEIVAAIFKRHLRDLKQKIVFFSTNQHKKSLEMASNPPGIYEPNNNLQNP
jgi:hypothetical protein